MWAIIFCHDLPQYILTEIYQTNKTHNNYKQESQINLYSHIQIFLLWKLLIIYQKLINKKQVLNNQSTI